MRPLTLDELDARADEFDGLAAGMTEVDGFCSSTLWGIPAHRAFLPDRLPRLYHGAHGYLALMEHQPRPGVRAWMPLETIWCLGCPLVGDRPGALADEGAAFLDATDEWDVLVLSGLPLDGALTIRLLGHLARRHTVLSFIEPTSRCVIDLEGGLDGYLARRSRNFRRSVARAEAAVRRAGITLTTVTFDATGMPAAFARLLDVERRSWKGMAADGLLLPEMQAFYREMVGRLTARGAPILTFARAGDRDVGFILGAMFAGTYRGLQFSYDDEFAAVGLGNALQCHTIAEMAARGALVYDLGAEVDYKRRWQDRSFRTVTVAIQR